jgi:hypothetical protein
VRRFGFLLVIVGFLGGALASVVNETAVRWGWFAAAVTVGIAGVVLVQISQRRHVRAVGRISSNMQAVEQSLRRIVENVTQLDARKQAIETHDIRRQVEELFADDLNTFVEARESLAHSYGLAVYGEVMNCFAAGERYLNRVWCASADGYVDEAHEYLAKAREQFAAGLDRVLSLQSSARSA